MYRNILVKLEDIANNNSGNLSVLAKYLYEYEGDLDTLTASKVCDELFLSIATSTRLAQKLGFTGFSEFKIYLKEEKKANDLYKHKYTSNVKTEYGKNILNTLNSALEKCDEGKIIEVADKIHKNDQIVLFAHGGTHNILNDFSYKLMRINKYVLCESSEDYQYINAVNSGDNSVCIGLSYSANTKQVIDNLRESHNNGSYTCLITNNNTKKYDFIDNIIYIGAGKNYERTYSISSRFAMLLILDLIFLNLIAKDQQKYNQILENTKMKQK